MDRLAGRQGRHVQAAQGVKFHSNANFKPTRDFNADDVLFSWSRMADDNHPFHKMTAGQTYAYFDDMGMKNIVDKVEKLDKYTVRFTLEASRGAVPRRHGDGFRLDHCRRSTSRR